MCNPDDWKRINAKLIENLRGKKKINMNKRQHGMWSKAGGTEGLRIIASISWGCVGDGDAGISLSSSQSNGIYVQHSGLQQGNKCLSLPQSHVVTPSPPTLPLSVCHLCIFTICVFIFPLVLCLHSTPTPPPFFSFAMHSLNLSHKEKKKERRWTLRVFPCLFTFIFSAQWLMQCSGPVAPHSSECALHSMEK